MFASKFNFKQQYRHIPVKLEEKQFNEFFLPYLSVGSRGPKPKISLFKIFNYILKILYTGMQWGELSIDKDEDGKPEIHYTRVYRFFRRWVKDGSLDKAFSNSVNLLAEHNKLDLSVLHGDGSSTIAKKGGDVIGYNGHKHFKGEKVVAIVDRNVNVLSPFTIAAGNKNESPLFAAALCSLKKVIKFIGASIKGSIMSLDGVYASCRNRKLIFNSAMIPNIPENKRNRKNKKRGRKQIYDSSIFEERFRTVERLFAWEDKFKRLLMRFERISKNHFGMKLIAFTLINLRHFCVA